MIEFELDAEIKTWLGSGSINFFGLPYAGKDHHADEFVERFDGTKIGGGEILRTLLENPNVNPRAKEIMESGALIPTEDFVNLAMPVVKEKALAASPLFLTALGRFIGEEEGVEEVLKETGHPTKAVVNLEIDESTLYDRFKAHEEKKLAGLSGTTRGERADDDEHKLEKRIDDFKTKTIPVINYYRERGLVIDIDATGPKEDVERAVLAALALRAVNS